MKKLRLILLAASIAASQALAKEVRSERFVFEIPEDVEFQRNPETEFYSFHWGEAPETNLLMLYPHPAKTPRRMLEPMSEMMVIAMEEELAEKPEIEVRSGQREAVTLGIFEGYELSFGLKGADYESVEQIVFLLYQDDRIWNAQLTSTGDAGKKARGILAGIRPATPARAEAPPPEPESRTEAASGATD